MTGGDKRDCTAQHDEQQRRCLISLSFFTYYYDYYDYYYSFSFFKFYLFFYFEKFHFSFLWRAEFQQFELPTGSSGRVG